MLFRYCLLLLPVMMSACGDGGSTTTTAVNEGDSTVAESNLPPAGDFYKRYSGTVASKPVVVQLHRLAGKMQGIYQYAAFGQMIELHNWLDTVDDDTYVLTEDVPGLHDDGATWSITIRGRSVSGEWWSSDSGQHYPIILSEEYPAGSTRLDAFYLADSTLLFPGKASSPKAVATHSYLLPASGAKGFLYNALRSQVAPDSKADEEIAASLKAADRAYFEAYRKENASLLQDAEASLFTFNYTSDEALRVLYNDRYWLVTELFSASYTGGAHGNYGSSYANIDLQGQKLWGITDIVVDTASLRPLLNDAAIKYFRLVPGEGMNQRLFVDDVYATANVYLSETGLCFVYNPYEIASYAAGEISLFLPYKKLMPLLTPAFKERMRLGSSSGVVMRYSSTKNHIGHG